VEDRTERSRHNKAFDTEPPIVSFLKSTLIGGCPVNANVRPQAQLNIHLSVSMQFLVYVDPTPMLHIDYAGRDETAGIIGSLLDLPDPIGTADTHELIMEIAYAHLGRHPSDMLYVADANGRVYDIVINRQYHDERSASGKAIVVARTCFVLTVLAFVTTVLLGLGYIGLILMVASIALYLAIVRSKFFNEIEAGVVCVILVLLTALLIPAIESAMRKSKNRTNHPMHGSGEVGRFEVEDFTSPPRDR